MTLNPSLDLSLVDMMDAIEPNKIEPTIEANIKNGIVSKLNWVDWKKSGNPIAVMSAALISPMIAIV
jgi:hypothetical protein